MLGNSAGGVTRQRYCQPSLPSTLDRNTQASGVAMVSLWAAMLFFCIPLSPIPTFLSNSLLRLKFPCFVSASEKLSLDSFSHGLILQEPKIHLQDMRDLTALPISSSHHSGLQQGWASASSPSPHLSRMCVVLSHFGKNQAISTEIKSFLG